MDKKFVNATYAFTLIECMVASVIFTLAVAGIFAAIKSLAGKSETQAVLDNKIAYGQAFLASLRQEVTPSQWVNGASLLACGGPYAIPGNALFSGYGGTYSVVCDASGARKVTLSITSP